MKKTLVRYKVHANKVEENEQLVRAVYRELRENDQADFQYMTLKLPDGQSFVHIAFAGSAEANAAFTQLPAFQKFLENLKERCEELPVANAVELIDAYNPPIFSQPLSVV